MIRLGRSRVRTLCIGTSKPPDPQGVEGRMNTAVLGSLFLDPEERFLQVLRPFDDIVETVVTQGLNWR